MSVLLAPAAASRTVPPATATRRTKATQARHRARISLSAKSHTALTEPNDRKWRAPGPWRRHAFQGDASTTWTGGMAHVSAESRCRPNRPPLPGRVRPGRASRQVSQAEAGRDRSATVRMADLPRRPGTYRLGRISISLGHFRSGQPLAAKSLRILFDASQGSCLGAPVDPPNAAG